MSLSRSENIFDQLPSDEEPANPNPENGRERSPLREKSPPRRRNDPSYMGCGNSEDEDEAIPSSQESLASSGSSVGGYSPSIDQLRHELKARDEENANLKKELFKLKSQLEKMQENFNKQLQEVHEANSKKLDSMTEKLMLAMERNAPKTQDQEMVSVLPKTAKNPAPSSDSDDGFVTVQNKKRKTNQSAKTLVNPLKIASDVNVNIVPSVEMRDLSKAVENASTVQAKKPKKGGRKSKQLQISQAVTAANEATAGEKGRCNSNYTNPAITVPTSVTQSNPIISASQNANSSAPPVRRDRIPPIVLREKIRFQEVLNIIKKGDEGIELSHTLSRKEGEHFFVKDTTSYRNLVKFLVKKGYQYHSFCLPEDRSYRVLIRGLPANKPVEIIKQALQERGFNPKFVKKWTNKSGADLGITQVVVPKEEKHILEITNLDFSVISVEMQKSNGQPVQCYNCQCFGHSAKHCGANPRCLKCAANHDTRNCLKTKNTPAKCCNCTQDHPANYSKCECRPPPRKIIKKTFIPAPVPITPAWNNQGGRRIAQNLSATPVNLSSQTPPSFFMPPPPEINPAALRNISPEMKQLIDHIQAHSRWTAQVAHAMTVPFFGTTN